MYEVMLERAAQHELKRLPAQDFHRIISRIKALSDIPRPRGCKKRVGSKSDWRIRIGNYRIVFEIDDREKVVRVMKVRRRSEAYD